MPLYAISTRQRLSLDLKTEIAQMITGVHCHHTGAPEWFVNVMFWTHIPLRGAEDIHVFASVRAGRPLVLQARLENAIVKRLASLVETSEARVGYGVFEVPSSDIMEGGAVLPEPGQEAAWLAKNAGHGPSSGAADSATSAPNRVGQA